MLAFIVNKLGATNPRISPGLIIKVDSIYISVPWFRFTLMDPALRVLFHRFQTIFDRIRAQLYGLGYPRQPSPRATLAEVTLSLFLSKIQPAVYIRIANSSRGARQLGWASCLTSAGRVTLASGTTFLHINALARLTRTSLGVANVT